MTLTDIMAALGAFSGMAAVVNSIINSRRNEANAKTIASLETEKLDLSAAELSHDITMDIIKTLRSEIKDCHAERDEFRTILAEKGLIPRSGT